MVTRSERSTGQSGCLGEVMLEVRAEGNAAGQGRFPKAGAETGGGGPGGLLGEGQPSLAAPTTHLNASASPRRAAALVRVQTLVPLFTST